MWRLLSPQTQRALEARAQQATDLVGASTRYTALDQIAQQTLAHMAAHPTHEFTQLARDVFDTDNDAVVSAAEVVAFAHMILRPDVDTDGDGARDAVSVAFGFDCAPAVVGVGPAF